MGYQLPSCGVDQSVMNLLSSLVPDWPDLDNDTRTTIKDIINALLCHLDARTIPYTTAAPETLDDVILNKLTGGEITGDVGINGKTDINGNLSVSGTTETNQFRMRVGVSGKPQVNYVLTSEDKNGNASWKPAPGAAWLLQADGDLVTDPKLVTNNVGINTSSPNARLHVRGNAIFGDALAGSTQHNSNIINVLSGENGNGNENGISFYENTSNFGMKIGYDGTLSGANNAIRFYNNDNEAVMSINNGGNIGINTTNPQASLHVAGQLAVSGAVFSNQVLASVSASNAVARNSNSPANVPNLSATIYAPQANSSIKMKFAYSNLTLPAFSTAQFRLITNSGVDQPIAIVQNLSLGSKNYSGDATVTFALPAGSTIVTIQWSTTGNCTLRNRSMTVTV